MLVFICIYGYIKVLFIGYILCLLYTIYVFLYIKLINGFFIKNFITIEKMCVYEIVNMSPENMCQISFSRQSRFLYLAKCPILETYTNFLFMSLYKLHSFVKVQIRFTPLCKVQQSLRSLCQHCIGIKKLPIALVFLRLLHRIMWPCVFFF